VLLQAANPEHYAVARALTHDFEGFCNEELEFRQELGYPPFGFLAAVQFSGTAEGATRDSAAQAARLLTLLKARLSLRVEILGPAQAPIYRLRGRFRQQILLKAHQRSDLRRLLTAYRRERTEYANVREALDIDPVDLL